MKGVDSGVMRVLLEYTYTSQAQLTHANVQQILEAACQFQVTGVHATTVVGWSRPGVGKLRPGDLMPPVKLFICFFIFKIFC